MSRGLGIPTVAPGPGRVLRRSSDRRRSQPALKSLNMSAVLPWQTLINALERANRDGRIPIDGSVGSLFQNLSEVIVQQSRESCAACKSVMFVRLRHHS